MNGYYIVGFVLFVVFLIWLLVFDQPTVRKLNAERQKNIDRMEKNRRDYRQRLNSRGKSSLDDGDLLDPTNPVNLLNPLSPFYLGDDSGHQSKPSRSNASDNPSQSNDSHSSGSSYSGSSFSSDSGGSSYSSSDSGGCSGGSE